MVLDVDEEEAGNDHYQHDQRPEDGLFAAVFLCNPTAKESAACAGNLEDDDEDDQLGGLETDTGCRQ